jgi:hypothetical protein
MFRDIEVHILKVCVGYLVASASDISYDTLTPLDLRYKQIGMQEVSNMGVMSYQSHDPSTINQPI